MDILNLVDNMSPDMYQRLKTAAETGKWPEGQVVDSKQRETALQITMAYQARRMNSDEIMTIGANGAIVEKSKSVLKKQFSTQPIIAKFDNL